MIRKIFLAALGCAPLLSSGTVALWLFDEQSNLYPSSVLNDCGPNNYILILGRGARIVEGRFGNALEPAEAAPLRMSGTSVGQNTESAKMFGLTPLPVPAGRTVPPMHWQNALFAALFTSGEKHLRSPGFANATETKLNLGAFDWTVEFWLHPAANAAEGVVFEIGEGPRGENDHVTRLLLDTGRGLFTLYNQPGGVKIEIRSAVQPGTGWHHCAFVYRSAERQLRHFIDGVPQPLPAKAELKPLSRGGEAYFSLGRDGLWQRPLPGRIDELRFSDHAVYSGKFTPPGSFSLTYSGRLPAAPLKAGPPLLFGMESGKPAVIELGSRKHLLLDDALLAETKNISFVPNPPRRMEKVADAVPGHLTMVEDEAGLIRLYYRGPRDSLAVMTSRDGVHWDRPDLGRGEYEGQRNIVLRKAVGLGVVFLDPNAPPEARWKYVSGIRRSSIFVFSSKDGFWFEPHETAALPFAAGSQSSVYYDDQRQLYVAHHRSDYGAFPGGSTRRRFVLSEVKDLLKPWPFEAVTPEKTREIAKTLPVQSSELDPWYLDNGPLSPGGFGVELPTIMASDDKIDPEGTDIYVTKAIKYPFAPDAYLAFPAIYFHYWDVGPAARRTLGMAERQRGSGVIETQLAVSRDGLAWKRYPRPAYVPVGGDGSNREHMLFVTHGLVRRGDELWQFVGGHGGSGTAYHSPWGKVRPAPLYRYVQRLDSFVAAEAPYTGGMLRTKPLRFEGNRLELNIDTGAVGYAQVGILDETGRPFPGYSTDQCIYINGDFLSVPVEWIGRGTDISPLAGKTVIIEIRMRGARLFALKTGTVRP